MFEVESQGQELKKAMPELLLLINIGSLRSNTEPRKSNLIFFLPYAVRRLP
jgi:hypothetical protein